MENTTKWENFKILTRCQLYSVTKLRMTWPGYINGLGKNCTKICDWKANEKILWET